MRGGSAMANVFDVAKYILEQRGTMSTMKQIQTQPTIEILFEM